jgi:hypothetical protein
MNYGGLLVKLIVKGLRDEESFFSKGNAAGERSTIKSVRAFNEDWIRFILLQQVIKHKKVFGQLEISSRGADFSIKQNDTVIVEVELKGPFGITEPSPGKVSEQYWNRILKDFERQAKGASISRDTLFCCHSGA